MRSSTEDHTRSLSGILQRSAKFSPCRTSSSSIYKHSSPPNILTLAFNTLWPNNFHRQLLSTTSKGLIDHIWKWSFKLKLWVLLERCVKLTGLSADLWKPRQGQICILGGHKDSIGDKDFKSKRMEISQYYPVQYYTLDMLSFETSTSGCLLASLAFVQGVERKTGILEGRDPHIHHFSAFPLTQPCLAFTTFFFHWLFWLPYVCRECLDVLTSG